MIDFAGRFLRTLAAFLLAAGTTYVLAAVFYTHRVLAKQAEIGVQFTTEQRVETHMANLGGLVVYGGVLAAGLVVAFLIAWGVKRILRPLAPIAYPTAGAAAVLAAVMFVEQQLGGGAGVLGGAREPVGVALQGLAGGVGGLVFALLRPAGQA